MGQLCVVQEGEVEMGEEDGTQLGEALSCWVRKLLVAHLLVGRPRYQEVEYPHHPV